MLMKTRKNYSLATCGLFLLTFAAQYLFLAPHQGLTPPGLIPVLLLDLLGAAFFLQGILLVASALLNYPPGIHTIFNLVSALMLVMLAWAYTQANLLIEGFTLLALGLAFFLNNWWETKRDWLINTMQWVNLSIGAGLFIIPEMLFKVQLSGFLVHASSIFGVLFSLSGLGGVVIGLFPAVFKGKAGRFLALPWFIWVLLFAPDFNLPHLGVAISIGTSLVLDEFVPWEKVSMRQAVDMGRRFFWLVAATQILTLALMTWMIRYTETSLNIAPENTHQIREVMLVAFNIIAGLGILTVTWINLSINGAFSGLAGSKNATQPHNKPAKFWKRLANRLFDPFETSESYISEIVDARKEYETLLARQLAAERRRVSQLSLLHELNLHLEVVLDPPVAAQLTVNAIHNAMGGCLTAVMRYDDVRDEMVVLAASGPNAIQIPPGYRQNTDTGIIGRTARLRRTQLASDTRLDPDYLHLENNNALSELVVPLLHNNRLRGVLVVDHEEANYFDDSDMRTFETVAIQLITSWIRSEHEQHLTSLINAGITLSTTLDVEGVIRQIAHVAQNTLDAHFTFVALVDQDGGFTRTAHVGYAPTLLGILGTDPGGNTLIQTILNSSSAVRLRDVRKKFSNTPTGNNELRSLLAIPIRLRQSSIGAILAFGKHGNNLFSESDEALIKLLATQSAAAIEATWLYQELRSMLATATQLYQLSTKVLLSEQLEDAASAIAETAFQLSKGLAAGIVLISPEKEVEARVQIDANGLQPGTQHPMDLINDALEHGQTIMVSGQKNMVRMCLPLQTPRRQYGALWVEVEEGQSNSARFTDTLHSLANQAAIALERGILLVETRKQAEEIERAYHELELTYDMTLEALSSALDARDRETEGHSLRVSRISTELGRRMGFTPEQAKVMERGAILHDIGKIGISDTILLKPGPLTPEEWETMRLHPDIGARIIEGIPFLKDALPVIRYHQERWDGTGYPIGLKGHEIPFMARIFSIVDAFDALTSERPYRKPISMMEAVNYLIEKANIHFDPEIVAEFAKMAEDGTLEKLL